LVSLLVTLLGSALTARAGADGAQGGDGRDAKKKALAEAERLLD
jgi:hypothetical protein